MQDQFDQHYPSANIQILGINEVGMDSNNAGFTDGRDLPWLQDVDANNNGSSDVWYDSWEITYRDVVVLDVNNEPVFTLNVTSSPLMIEENFNTLKAAFVGEIVPDAQTAWQNPIEPLNVSGDDVIAPLDALLTINALSDYPTGTLPASIGNQAPYLDPSGDGIISPVDPAARDQSTHGEFPRQQFESRARSDSVSKRRTTGRRGAATIVPTGNWLDLARRSVHLVLQMEYWQLL